MELQYHSTIAVIIAGTVLVLYHGTWYLLVPHAQQTQPALNSLAQIRAWSCRRSAIFAPGVLYSLHRT